MRVNSDLSFTILSRLLKFHQLEKKNLRKLLAERNKEFDEDRTYCLLPLASSTFSDAFAEASSSHDRERAFAKTSHAVTLSQLGVFLS